MAKPVNGLQGVAEAVQNFAVNQHVCKNEWSQPVPPRETALRKDCRTKMKGSEWNEDSFDQSTDSIGFL
jgi:hypothetical protein